MNWGSIATEWQQLKSRLRRLWGKLASGGHASQKDMTLSRTQGAFT